MDLASWGGYNHQFKERMSRVGSRIASSSLFGETFTSSFERNILDMCPLTCGLQQHLPWGDLPSALSQTGEFARLQESEAGSWCVDPASGAGMPPGTNSSTPCEWSSLPLPQPLL